MMAFFYDIKITVQDENDNSKYAEHTIDAGLISAASLEKALNAVREAWEHEND